jgi:hypothetical protein
MQSKQWAGLIVARDGILQNSQWISKEMGNCVPKTIVWKKYEQTMNHI